MKAVKRDQIVNMSNADTGALLWSVGSLSPYLGGVWKFSFAQNGQYVAGEYLDDMLRVLRVVNGECVVSENTGEGGRWRLSHDGKMLVVGGVLKPLNTFRVIEL